MGGAAQQEIVELNIPTGVPLVQELDDRLKSVRHYYLGDPARIEKAMQSAASTGSTTGSAV